MILFKDVIKNFGSKLVSTFKKVKLYSMDLGKKIILLKKLLIIFSVMMMIWEFYALINHPVEYNDVKNIKSYFK